MRSALLLCLLAGLLSGCPKKSSPEFYKLEADQSILVARDGDDAWVSPEMTGIVAGLTAIPDNAIEKPRAQALVAKIAAERARVTAERVEPPKGPQVDPFAGRLSPSGTTTEVEAVSPPPETTEGDAGAEPLAPWARMEEKRFVALFGKCFASGPAAVTSDGGAATTQVLATSADCQKRFGAPNGVTSFLFTDKGLSEKIVETTVVIDAGTVTTPGRQPPTPDAGPPVLLIPGAPMPEGVDANY